jgi:predicted esterase
MRRALIAGMPVASTIRIERLSTRRTARCAVLGPDDPAEARALWIVLHGYGQLATEFVSGFGAVSDGTRLIVAPEALSRFYDARARAEAHAEASVGASWMTREERLHEIDDYVGWLQQSYESFRERIGREVPLTVLGFSQGAAAASRWVAQGTVRPRRLVCWGASIAPELDLGTASALRRMTCSLVVGTTDRFVTAERVAAERARLDSAGFPYEFVAFPGGHRLDDATLERFAAAS